MTSSFQTAAHCARHARRLAFGRGQTMHVIATRDERQRYFVLDEVELFARGDEFGPEDLILTVDPFVSESWTG
ncbi:MAG: hypothetical protein WA979_09705 [Pacificimonas sp.]